MSAVVTQATARAEGRTRERRPRFPSEKCPRSGRKPNFRRAFRWTRRELNPSGLIAIALSNYELHLRKVFWVGEPLSWLLGATKLDVTGDAVRLPFRSLALVFADRYALGLAERMDSRPPPEIPWPSAPLGVRTSQWKPGAPRVSKS